VRAVQGLAPQVCSGRRGLPACLRPPPPPLTALAWAARVPNPVVLDIDHAAGGAGTWPLWPPSSAIANLSSWPSPATRCEGEPLPASRRRRDQEPLTAPGFVLASAAQFLYQDPNTPDQIKNIFAAHRFKGGLRARPGGARLLSRARSWF
jgi:hypothetical protein